MYPALRWWQQNTITLCLHGNFAVTLRKCFHHVSHCRQIQFQNVESFTIHNYIGTVRCVLAVIAAMYVVLAQWIGLFGKQ